MANITKTDEQWKTELSAQEYNVCREKGTEAPFSGIYNDNKTEGIYSCTCCGEELFPSSTKFDSGTGWPSYFQPINETAVGENRDEAYGMLRVEVVCANCDSHLGHVFPDGPAPTGQRYCINSVSLKFQEK